MTAFGVGELSSINAVAGAYAEMIPLVHIVGVPSTKLQDNGGLFLHHSLGTGDFRVFSKMHEPIVAARLFLDNSATAPKAIDWILSKCLEESRPVYIELPTDMVKVVVDGQRLMKDLIVRNSSLSAVDAGMQIQDCSTILVGEILDRIYDAKDPVILVDGCAAAKNVRVPPSMNINESRWSNMLFRLELRLTGLHGRWISLSL